MKKRVVPYLLLTPMLVLCTILMISMFNGMIQSLGVIPAFNMTKPTLKYYVEVFSDSNLMSSIGLSLYISIITTVLAVAFGSLLCWWLVTKKRENSLSGRALRIPILVPHTVVAILTINLLSSTGLLSRLLFAIGVDGAEEWMSPVLYTPDSLGVIFAYLWKEIPFVCYFVVSIMGSIDSSYGEAARNLGAGKWKAFWYVTLPLCKPAILNSALIIFCYSFGAYELPLLLGSTLPKAVPVQAYVEYVHPDLTHRPYSMVLNMIMLFICFLAALAYYLLVNRQIGERRKKK